MSYENALFYRVVCDQCGHPYEGDDFDWWFYPQQAEDAAVDDGWQEHDGAHYCPDCRHVQCDVCGRFRPDDATGWVEEDDDWYCPDCWTRSIEVKQC
ncbi:hypothetical protein [Bifidobacterium sp. SO1]|uniref:hypothetical protein n=1 Tax=Bifidobacterium sp. SO1 TaxID=2809029 RepID=UPI001BDD6A10|nr:hypothetical protein [Bifidobacterium sp. SO1]MBT1161265.1 hypothetical protein [Bifidobacterium sp. SO1]